MRVSLLHLALHTRPRSIVIKSCRSGTSRHAVAALPSREWMTLQHYVPDNACGPYLITACRGAR